MQISADNEDVVTGSWLISSNATKFVGNLNFIIKFKCVGSDSKVEYEWNTAVYKGISIGSGINNTEYIAKEYADILAAWEARIAALESGGIPGGTVAAVSRIGYVELLADNWVGNDVVFTQEVTVEGATEKTQVDLTPDAEQLAVFYNKKLTLVAINRNGTVTAYAIGQKLLNNYTMQATLTEVDKAGEIIGIAVGTAMNPDNIKPDENELKELLSDYFAEFKQEIKNEIKIPTKLSELENDSDFLTEHQSLEGYVKEDDLPESLPASDVYTWAKQPSKPAYSASEVGADAEGTAATKVSEHNTKPDAHNDIRLLITELTNRLNALADSDDITLDQASEFVAYIKANRSLIESITTSKVNVTDIINNLTTNVTNKPLSAAQGVVLKGLIDELSNSISQIDMTSCVKKDEVYDYTEIPKFTNIFDTVGIEYGKMLNTDGTISDTTASLATTDFIPVKVGQVISMADFAGHIDGSARVVTYDVNKTKLQSCQMGSMASQTYYFTILDTDSNGNVTSFKVEKPSTVDFIRICTNTSVIGANPVLTIDEPIEYEMGYGTKLNSKVKVDYSQLINSPTKNCWSILPNEHINIAYSQVNANGKAVKPINTLEHFVHVAENYGYNTLKCDVRPTSDGELVLCHDAGFTFDSNGKITAYDSNNQTLIHDVTSTTVLGYTHPTGEHPCLVGDYLDICRKYGKVAFITIRNEYMDVVIPKLIEELKKHNMTYATIINCMTYESLVTWRSLDKDIMINYTLSYGANMDSAAIDKAISLGYCSLCGFGLSSSSTVPSTTCDFAYARANGIRLLQAIAYKEGTAEDCYALGYDGCQIGYAWQPKENVTDLINNAIGNAIGGSY